jgi:DNA-binding beta-propeller fold protein YncE
MIAHSVAKPLLLALVLGSFSMTGSARAELVRIYVTNSAGDSVHVVDPGTNKVVQVFKGPEAMHGVAFAPDGSRVYVSNEHDRTLDVFSREGGKLIKQVKLSDRPNNIAVAKDGRIAVGIARGPGALDIVDPKTLELHATIPVNGRLHTVYVPRDQQIRHHRIDPEQGDDCH